MNDRKSRRLRLFLFPRHSRFAKMSVFPMAHNLTNGHPTNKDYIQPFTVMAEEHPPSPEQEEPLLRSGDCGSSPR
jgi:hypothetical protein